MKTSTQINVKYFLDQCFSIILLAILSPLFFIIAVAVKSEDGHSIFFKHQRPGLNGEPFEIWKFRTMILNSDSFLDEKGRVTNTSRITRIGKFLRLFSLDELPQLINIAKGQMSFIGPRPALCEHIERYTDIQKRRFKMKPGVTGLAQINGRNTLKWSKRIEFDLSYINHYSLLLDFKIFLRTIKVVINREGIVLDRKPEIYDDLGKEKISGREKVIL